MFQKDHSCDGFDRDCKISKSEKRKLLSQVREFFGESMLDHDDDDALEAAFTHGNIICRQIQHPDLHRAALFIRSPAQDEDDDWPYKASSQVVWIKTHRRDCPTLALLSTLKPSCLPQVKVNPAVSKLLCDGAHLMRTGILSVPDEMRDDRIVAVVADGNPQPMAVGPLGSKVNSKDDIGHGNTGVGVKIWSCYGDEIWRLQRDKTSSEGIQNPVGGAVFDNGHYGNEGFHKGKRVKPIAKCEFDDKEEEVTAAADQEAAQDIAQEDQEEILHQAFCKALVYLKKKNLPLPVDEFYEKWLLPHRPEGTTIDMGKTRYKKFDPYLLEQVARGLVEVKADEGKKSTVLCIKSVDRKHRDLKQAKKAQKKEEEAAKREKEEDADDDDADDAALLKGRLIHVNLYAVPTKFRERLNIPKELISAADAASKARKNTGFLTTKEAIAVMDYYIEREKLEEHGNYVQLNDVLCYTFYKKTEVAQRSLSHSSVIELWLGKLKTAYALVYMPGSKIYKIGRGDPPFVSLDVDVVGENKYVTRVRGVEFFDIKAKKFLKEVTKRIKCQGKINKKPVDEDIGRLPDGHVELEFEGMITSELEALLTGNESLSDNPACRGSPHCIPRTLIEIYLRKGVPDIKI